MINLGSIPVIYKIDIARTLFILFYYFRYKINDKIQTIEVNFTASISELKKSPAQILKQAVPSCLNHLSMSLGGLVMLKFVSFYGTDAIAGYGIALRIEQIVGLPTIGIASAVMSIVARNFGAREYGRVLECYKSALKIVFYYCLFACAFCVFVGVHVAAAFKAGETAIAIAQSFLLTVAFTYFGYGVMNISGGVLQGVRRPIAVFILNFIRQIVLQICIFSFIVFTLKGVVADIWLGVMCNVYFIAICFLLYTFYALRRVKLAS